MLRLLTRAFLIDRLLNRSQGRRYGRHGRHRRHGGYGRSYSRGRGGFFGPMPYYSRRTRGGSRVTVGGCCLPIPLALMATLGLGARLLVRR
jgi:hypothetical protein